MGVMGDGAWNLACLEITTSSTTARRALRSHFAPLSMRRMGLPMINR